MSDFMDDALDKGKALAKSKEARNALKLLDKHRDDLEELGKDHAQVLLGKLGLGQDDDAREYMAIMSMSPAQLIEGMTGSGERLKEAHRLAVERAERHKALINDLAGDAARIALALLVAAL